MQAPTKILIVEDEEILARNLQSFLARVAPDVRVATDARRTMEILESFTPDIVLLDYDLPVINGIQIYAAILRRSAPEAGCVMMTGHLSASVVGAAQEEGIRHILCKPFSFAELQKVIGHLTRESPLLSGVSQHGALTVPQPPDEVALSGELRGVDHRHHRDRRILQERRRSMC